MELVPTKGKNLEEGQHTGVITRIDYRETPYKYTDVIIEVSGQDGLERKYGCPTSAGIDSKLMRLLAKFTEVEEGKPVDIEKTLVGQNVKFMIQHEEKDDKSFDRVVENSVKPNQQVTEEKVSQ